MNTFKHKSLYAALAGLGALGATGIASAVSVNHEGLGQVLIYPYYTVRTVPTGLVGVDAAYNSLLSVVNSTASAKAVKVRFLEGKNSREVLDFNLYLSAKDVWTAAIIPTTDGAGIFTADKSCTVPIVSSNSASPTPFVVYAFTGSNDDKGGSTPDRTREGYAEIIEMGDVIGTTAAAATHGTSGSPPCTASALTQPTAPGNTVAGTGGLFGSMTLVNVLKGEDFGVDPTALDGWSTIPRWFAEGDIRPTLALVNPKTSVVVSGFNVYVTPNWPVSPTAGANDVDPVSAILMHNNVYNEFVLDVSTKSKTDWVVTFPTKREYVNAGSGVAQKLFQNNFNGTSCDDVVLTQYDREERTIQSSTNFSPPPPTQTDSLCYEANVISYVYPSSAATPTQSTVFGSKNFSAVRTDFVNGWVTLNFPLVGTRHQLVGPGSTVFNTRTGQTIGTLSTTFNGLPVIGFAGIVFENESLSIGPGSAIQSNYGGNFNHKLTTSIQ